MTYKAVIPGRLPGFNEYIRACRTNAYKGNQMKHIAQRDCEIFLRKAFKGAHVKTPVMIHYKWYEPNKKRDLDNISGMGHKVIQDALVTLQILPGDGWRDIVGFTDSFKVDAKYPRIEIILEEV